jgi:mono/diheme cytochrome c family protein
MCAAFVALVVVPMRGLQTTSANGSRSIWDGVYTEAQATRGQQTYKQSCSLCHKDDLFGQADAPALVGPEFLNRFNGSNVDDVMQTIKASMPQDAPGSLSAAAYVDLVGYLLKSNGGQAGAVDLPSEREKLREILVTRQK